MHTPHTPHTTHAPQTTHSPHHTTHTTHIHLPDTPEVSTFLTSTRNNYHSWHPLCTPQWLSACDCRGRSIWGAYPEWFVWSTWGMGGGGRGGYVCGESMCACVERCLWRWRWVFISLSWWHTWYGKACCNWLKMLSTAAANDALPLRSLNV